MPSFYMNAPDCICSPGRLPLGAFCAGRDDLEREALHDDRISIRAPRAGRDFLRLQDIARALISIHAPRVGRDAIGIQAARIEAISIHAPRVGRDVEGKCAQIRSARFQSTRPVWGATRLRRKKIQTRRKFQSTRPVWGATSLSAIIKPSKGFQSTRPVWGATAAARGRPAAPTYFNPRAPCGARRRST